MKKPIIVVLTSALVVGSLFTAPPAAAGVRALFSDGFESGNTTPWTQPVRFVVFEGFYNPG